MHDRLDRAIYEWGAGAAIAWSPIACHLLVASVSDRPTPTDSWAIDLVLVALTTAGLSVVTLLARLTRGAIVLERIPAHCFIVVAINLMAFLASGIVYGAAMTHPQNASITLPVALLVCVTGLALYFEVVVVMAMAETG
jgi:hypothetical protein